MHKKITLPVLIAAMVLQLLVPGFIIGKSELEKQHTIKDGTELKVRVSGVYINPFVGKKVNYSVFDDYYYFDEYDAVDFDDTYYAVLENNEKGFAQLKTIVQNEPDDSVSYIKCKSFAYNIINSSVSLSGNTYKRAIDILYDCRVRHDGELCLYYYNENSEIAQEERHTIYATIIVCDGSFQTTGLYIDDKPIEQFLLEYSSPGTSSSGAET